MVRMIWLPLWVLLLVGCSDSSSEADSRGDGYRHRVATLAAEWQSEYSVVRQLVGRVEARQRAALGFELPGRVSELLVDEGSEVERGQILARLDVQLLEVEREALMARQQELSARQKLAEVELQRQRKLSGQGFAAQQRIDQLQAEIAALQAQQRGVVAELSGVATRIEKSTLVAPYAAKVAARFVDQGSVVQGGQRVFRVLEREGVEARFGVPAAMVEALKVGESVQVEVAGRQERGEIAAIGGYLDPATHTVSVRVVLPSTRGWSDGEVLYLLLEEQRHKAGFWVPQSALYGTVRGLWELYVVVEPDGEEPYLERRSIELVHTAKARAYVSGAVKSGERIVSAGLQRLAPGLRVRLESQSDAE